METHELDAELVIGGRKIGVTMTVEMDDGAVQEVILDGSSILGVFDELDLDYIAEYLAG